MAQAAPQALCAIHPGTQAVALCDLCSKPLCEACRHEDVSTDAVFCSASCLTAHRAASGGLPGITHAKLLEGYKRPIINGWKLWLRSFPALALHVAPLAVLAGVVYQRILEPVEGEASEAFRVADVGLLVGLLMVLVFGVALVQVVLSQQYTRLVRGNAVQWTLRRFVFWAATGILIIIVTLLGYIALIVPGVILSLRLFWADEFALVHEHGPIRALKESWRLTKGEAGNVFVFQFLAGLAAYVPLLLLGLAFVALGLVLNVLVLNVMRGGVSGMRVAEGALLSFIILSFYSVLHAPEIVYFYGMRAARAMPVASEGKILNI